MTTSMNEWLKIMLEEIDRKKREEQEAAGEEGENRPKKMPPSWQRKARRSSRSKK